MTRDAIKNLLKVVRYSFPFIYSQEKAFCVPAVSVVTLFVDPLSLSLLLIPTDLLSGLFLRVIYSKKNLK